MSPRRNTLAFDLHQDSLLATQQHPSTARKLDLDYVVPSSHAEVRLPDEDPSSQALIGEALAGVPRRFKDLGSQLQQA